MASVQERLQMKRVPLENWSISEQLYLASAVACSGDQNWMSVSRSLKMICGHNRPSDWFSQKSCAAQYEMLLENVETPKRKKRNEKDTSQTIVETPIELIVRKLTQERIAELNKLLQDERDEYLKIKDEIVGIQSNRYDDNQLREMLAQIDAEEKQREREKIKYAQWLKEREERKREMERAWRPTTNLLHQSPTSTVHSPTITQHLGQKVKIEEMEIDDPNSKQGTSPLLTSLLKSPSAAPNPSPSMLHNISNTQTRVAAPTITNLLTGSVTNLSNSLAAVAQQTTPKTITTSATAITTPFPSQIQNQPLTGPAPNDQSLNNITQSPSQAAPTLSMLLESKQKENLMKMNAMSRLDIQHSMNQMIQQAKGLASSSDITPKSEPNDTDLNNAESPIKDEDQQLMEVFNELIPDDIDELADIILDGLIDEEQVAAVSTAAESFASQDNLVLKNFHSTETPATINEVPIKEEPTNLNENACDASDMITKKIDESSTQIEQNKDDIVEKIESESLSKDDDSSDLSNDTPLSELIKQDASAKQQQQMKLQSPSPVQDVKKEETIENEQIIEAESTDDINEDLGILSEPQPTEQHQSNDEKIDLNVVKNDAEQPNDQVENEINQMNVEEESTEPNQLETVSSPLKQEDNSTKLSIELIPIDSSDSSDEKSLDNIKREIEALPELRDSNENSPAAQDESPAEEITEAVIIEPVIETKPGRSSSRKESSRKSDAKADSKKSIKEEKLKEENFESTAIDETIKIEEKPTKKDRKSSKTEIIEKVEEIEMPIEESIEISDEMDKVDDLVKEETQPESTTEENVVETVEIIDDTLDDHNIKEIPVTSSENTESENAQAADTTKTELKDENDGKDEENKQDSVIIIEEGDDMTTEKPITPSTSKDDAPSENVKAEIETKEKSVTPVAAERKASSDDEIFEDAKENLDEVVQKEPEIEPEKPIIPPTITVDTDDDAPFIEVAKEDKVGRVKRDYSRRKQDHNQSIDKRDDANDDVASGSISSRLRMKDRDRSESPFIEEDTGEPSSKYRRRYSTTPLVDSLPNSPASSDDREYRSWKKSILLVYNSLATHRCASVFSKPITEEQAPNYKTIILNPMDLQTLKRNIDSGLIRTTIEFKRYIMLMCYNSIFYNINDDLTCSRAKEMLNDALGIIGDFAETWKKENEKPIIPIPTNNTAKGRGRKSKQK